MPDSGYFINYPEKGLFMKCIQEFSALNNPYLYMPESNIIKLNKNYDK